MPCHFSSSFIVHKLYQWHLYLVLCVRSLFMYAKRLVVIQGRESLCEQECVWHVLTHSFGENLSQLTKFNFKLFSLSLSNIFLWTYWLLPLHWLFVQSKYWINHNPFQSKKCSINGLRTMIHLQSCIIVGVVNRKSSKVAWGIFQFWHKIFFNEKWEKIFQELLILWYFAAWSNLLQRNGNLINERSEIYLIFFIFLVPLSYERGREEDIIEQFY